MDLGKTIGIIFDLLSERRVTASEICNKYEMSRRTAYRYIDAISTVVPVYTTRGSNGGFSVTDEFRLPATFLTEGEYRVVLEALEAFSKEVPVGELQSAIAKIKANSKSARRYSLGSSSLMIDSGPWGVTPNYTNKLRVLEECVAFSYPAAIKYRDMAGVVSERTVEPHTLVLKQGIWYIYAFCRLRGEFRLFKVGRIESIIVDRTPFERRSVEDIQSALSYVDDPDCLEVTLELDPSVVSEAEEWLGVECVEKKGEKFIARAALPVNEVLVSRLLGFGGKVRVLSPTQLLHSVKRAAEEMARLYV